MCFVNATMEHSASPSLTQKRRIRLFTGNIHNPYGIGLQAHTISLDHTFLMQLSCPYQFLPFIIDQGLFMMLCTDSQDDFIHHGISLFDRWGS
jgi:hypothetical protein